MTHNIEIDTRDLVLILVTSVAFLWGMKYVLEKCAQQLSDGGINSTTTQNVFRVLYPIGMISSIL